MLGKTLGKICARYVEPVNHGPPARVGGTSVARCNRVVSRLSHAPYHGVMPFDLWCVQCRAYNRHEHDVPCDEEVELWRRLRLNWC